MMALVSPWHKIELHRSHFQDLDGQDSRRLIMAEFERDAMERGMRVVEAKITNDLETSWVVLEWRGVPEGETAELPEEELAALRCAECGQIAGTHTGEYPCPVCGEPTTWDEEPSS